MPGYTEERIQKFCQEALAAKTSAELERVIPELRRSAGGTHAPGQGIPGQRNGIAARDAASETNTKARKDPPQE